MPSWTKELEARLASLRLRPAREREIIDELSEHLELRYAELRDQGVDETEALALVRAELLDDEALAELHAAAAPGERAAAARARGRAAPATLRGFPAGPSLRAAPTGCGRRASPRSRFSRLRSGSARPPPSSARSMPFC